VFRYLPARHREEVEAAEVEGSAPFLEVALDPVD
jgi:hypothetical protein